MTQNIEQESIAYKSMKRMYMLADDLEMGTFAMRARGATWLPSFRGEDSEEYGWRLNNAYLRNILGRAADIIVGHIFREGLDKTDLNLDEVITSDFDLMGSTIDAYAAKVCRKLLTHGIAHTFTDFRRAEGESTLHDEKTGVTRPYATFIEPADLIFALPRYSAGAEETLEARWRVMNTYAVGLEDTESQEIRRIRILTEQEALKVGEEVLYFGAGSVLYEVWAPGVGGATGYGLERVGEFKGIEKLPLQTAYSDKRGFMRTVATLEPVALKNLEHWQASSDHNSIVQMSRFAMFYATGVTKEEANKIVTLGPRVKLVSTNPEARFGYAEIQGTSVEQSFKDLERISREADERSIEALYKAGSDTATGRRIDLLENMSPAQIVAVETERHINNVLGDFGKWLNRDLGRVTINTDFGFGENEAKIIEALHKARAAGDIDRIYYLTRLQELGVIGDDVKVEVLAQDAANESAEAMAQFNANLGQGSEHEDSDDDDLE